MGQLPQLQTVCADCGSFLPFFFCSQMRSTRPNMPSLEITEQILTVRANCLLTKLRDGLNAQHSFHRVLLNGMKGVDLEEDDEEAPSKPKSRKRKRTRQRRLLWEGGCPVAETDAEELDGAETVNTDMNDNKGETMDQDVVNKHVEKTKAEETEMDQLAADAKMAKFLKHAQPRVH
ncbi:hypothetical protein BJ741DRAFT_120779 [Chytriomyces cf. hyalinus JEL632]|nr:hypothetical protein BJ741DRAFT_120779 [Chytriomyces cf. hyalinus JEL632]